MEGLTILYSEKYVAKHEFDLAAFLILSTVFILAAFIICIWFFVHNCSTKKEGVVGGCIVATLISIISSSLSALTASQPIYKDQYACTIDFSIIDQEEFENAYEIVEQKGSMYVIRGRYNDNN